MMQKNVGMIDRMIRLAAGFVLGLLYLTDRLSGPAGMILGIAGLVLIVTSFMGRCLLYNLLGICTVFPRVSTKEEVAK
jgi:hypothetical protein